MTNLVRMLDYVLLEALKESCFRSFVEAQNSVCTEQSAVFLTEVYFNDEGKVSFNPSFEQLTKTILDTFQSALVTLDNLPRLLRHPDLRDILTAGPFDVPKLLEEGPEFQMFAKSSPLIGTVMKTIIKTISDSYSQATLYAQIFNEFYPLYKLGKNWNVRDYIIKTDKTPYTGPLSILDRPMDEEDDEFLLHPENEPYVDFGKVQEIINNLRLEEHKVKDIRAGIVRGAIYVDSKEIKQILTPIPRTSLQSLQVTLKDLMNLKIDLVSRAIKNFNFKLKSEPVNVDVYIDFCEALQKVLKIQPQLLEEIKFVDKIIVLLQAMDVEVAQNPLQAKYKSFLKHIEVSKSVQAAQFEKYCFVIEGLVDKAQNEVSNLSFINQA